MQTHKLAKSILLSGLIVFAAQVKADANIATSSASVSALTFELIDLDPTDGITPQISFTPINPTGSLAHIAYADGTRKFVPSPSSPVPCCNTYPYLSNETQPVTAEAVLAPSGASVAAFSADGTSEGHITFDTMRVAAHVTKADITNFADQNTEGAAYFAPGADWTLTTSASGSRADASGVSVLPDITDYSGGATELKSYQQLSSPAYSNFVLSPNTAVVFTGNLAAQADFDSQAMSDAPFSATSYGIFTRAEAAIALVKPADGSTGWSSYQEFSDAYQYQATLLNAVNVSATNHDNIENSPNSTQSFSFRLDNLQSTQAGGRLGLYVSSYIEMAGNGAVPEPSTYALLILGLLGVAAAAHCRKNT